MLNLALILFGSGVYSLAEALKINMQRGVYEKHGRMARLIIALMTTVVAVWTLGAPLFVQILIVIMLFAIAGEWLLPWRNGTFLLRNARPEDDLTALEALLEERRICYERSLNEDRHLVLLFPAYPKTKMVVKEKDSFVNDVYPTRTELTVRIRGMGNPLRETVDDYLIDRREAREAGGFTKTALLYLVLAVIAVLAGVAMFYAAWQSPHEIPNMQR
ncbi:hypothetical protein [Salisediminibacterium selenitireducens]|uniref:Uncharacterized protein n=1 Tax=Bacillus selenitireducens (strain ATCC 700615 / DSM 15326 / MLS10) TaxID=439292 RepID=D6XXA4_BACIE|nr:hypothetical protein [Salisediminibacterium selenitireducens]ADH97961.1 hypothetical protein Bsel_0422 [[Bacillus] selenitireducens MLS10]